MHLCTMYAVTMDLVELNFTDFSKFLLICSIIIPLQLLLFVICNLVLYLIRILLNSLHDIDTQLKYPLKCCT